MFITLDIIDHNEETKTIQVNTHHIAFIVEDFVHMSNAASFKLDEENMKLLREDLFGDEKEASPAASQHTTQLLNELHKLCGGRNDAKPTSDRKARLKTRLKDFTEEDLKLAATNLGNDEFMQGDNDKGKRYGTIDYLLRTSANVNKWMEEQPEKKKSMF